MILKQLKVETCQGIITNTYIVCNGGEAMVIDPGGEAEKINKTLEELNVKVKYILLTHCHVDHVYATLDVKEKNNGKVLISQIDGDGLKNPIMNLAPFLGVKMPEIEPDIIVKENDIFKLGDLEFKILATPGHTKGSISVYCEKEGVVFSGDTLFKNAYGRIDLPSGSFDAIAKSIVYKLHTLPKETIVYPGHGDTTKIEDELDLKV